MRNLLKDTVDVWTTAKTKDYWTKGPQSIYEQFPVGCRVTHPKYGKGVVMAYTTAFAVYGMPSHYLVVRLNNMLTAKSIENKTYNLAMLILNPKLCKRTLREKNSL